MSAWIVPDDLRDLLSMNGSSVTDESLEQTSQTAQNAVLRYLPALDSDGDPIDYSADPDVLHAITVVAVDFYQSIKSPGGQATGLDFQPAPRINAFIVQRAVQSFCFHHMKAESFFA